MTRVKAVYIWKKFWKNSLNRIVLFALVLVMSLGILMNYVLGKPARDEVVEKGAQLQLLEAKTGGIVLRRFLDRVGRFGEVLADNNQIRSLSFDSREEMKKALEAWKDTALEELVLIDKDGKVLVVENIMGIRTGEIVVNVADREYFIKAMTQESTKYAIGEPIVPRGGHAAGEYVVPIAIPVVSEGVKVGVLLLNVRIQKLAEDYFKQIGVSDETRVYLLRDDGQIMYSDDEELIGINVFEELDRLKIVGREKVKSEIRNAFIEREGYKKVVAPTSVDGDFESQVGSYYAMELDGEMALMILVTPERVMLGDMGPMYVRRMFIVIVSFLAVLIFGIRVAKSVGYDEAKQNKK